MEVAAIHSLGTAHGTQTSSSSDPMIPYCSHGNKPLSGMVRCESLELDGAAATKVYWPSMPRPPACLGTDEPTWQTAVHGVPVRESPSLKEQQRVGISPQGSHSERGREDVSTDRWRYSRSTWQWETPKVGAKTRSLATLNIFIPKG